MHSDGDRKPFISRGLFKDRNFVIGNTFIFMVGVVLFATLALMPPMLQGLWISGVLAGLVTAPRGVGTWVSMVVVGRLTGSGRCALLIAIGFALRCDFAVADGSFSPQIDS